MALISESGWARCHCKDELSQGVKEKRQRAKQIFRERASKAEQQVHVLWGGMCWHGWQQEGGHVATAGSEESMAQVKSGGAGRGR